MRPLRWALAISLLAALAFLEITFLALADLVAAGVVLALVAGWSLSLWRRSRWHHLAFASLAVMAIYAALQPFPPFLTLAALTLCLAAWDLSEFYLLLSQFDPQPDAETLARPHLERVSLLAIVGFALGCLALLLRLRLKFEVAILLGLLIFLGMAQAIRFLRSIAD